MGDAATQLEFTQAMADFRIMFPNMEVDVIEAVLRSNNGAVDTTIDQLLSMSADNEPVGGGRGKGGDLPPAYGEAMKNQGEHGRQFGDQADCGPFGPASSLGPDLLASLGASGGSSMGTPLHAQKGWKPPMLGRLPPDFLRISSRPAHSRGASERQSGLGQGHAYNHPDRHRPPPPETSRGDPSGQISEDERFAQMLQNEEFMTELRGNTEFLSTLEEENRREEEAAPTPRRSHLGMDDAMFREKLRTMGKSSKAKFTKLATMFSRRAPNMGGAGRMLGQAPAPSKDNLLLNAEPLVNCRDSDEESEGEEKHKTTKGRKYQLM